MATTSEKEVRMIDIIGGDVDLLYERQTSGRTHRLWVNVDGICRLRINTFSFTQQGFEYIGYDMLQLAKALIDTADRSEDLFSESNPSSQTSRIYTAADELPSDVKDIVCLLLIACWNDALEWARKYHGQKES